MVDGHPFSWIELLISNLSIWRALWDEVSHFFVKNIRWGWSSYKRMVESSLQVHEYSLVPPLLPISFRRPALTLKRVQNIPQRSSSFSGKIYNVPNHTWRPGHVSRWQLLVVERSDSLKCGLKIWEGSIFETCNTMENCHRFMTDLPTQPRYSINQQNQLSRNRFSRYSESE